MNRISKGIRNQFRRSKLYPVMVEQIAAVMALDLPGMRPSLCVVKSVQCSLAIDLGPKFDRHLYSPMFIGVVLRDQFGLKSVGYHRIPSYGMSPILSDDPSQYGAVGTVDEDVLGEYRRQMLGGRQTGVRRIRQTG